MIINIVRSESSLSISYSTPERVEEDGFPLFVSSDLSELLLGTVRLHLLSEYPPKYIFLSDDVACYVIHQLTTGRLSNLFSGVIVINERVVYSDYDEFKPGDYLRLNSVGVVTSMTPENVSLRQRLGVPIDA